MFGLIYFQLELNQNSVMNYNGILFLCLTNNSFGNMFAVINTYTAEMPIFFREHQNRMYRVSSYYLSKSMVDLPGYIILPFVSLTIVYWMANIGNDLQKFLICAGIIGKFSFKIDFRK